MSRIAKRYGRALFNITKGDVATAKRQQAVLATVTELFQNPDAGRILVSPVMPPDLKKSLLDYALDKANADDDMRHTIGAIVAAGRVDQLPAVARAFDELIDEAQGIVRADVTSAVELKQAELDDISQALGKVLKKNVTVKSAVDPSLLGGFVANVGNYRIDMSLKTKLDGLSQTAVQDSLR